MNENEQMSSASADLSSDFATLRNDVNRLSASVAALVQHQTESARDVVAKAASEAREKLNVALSDAQQKVKGAGGEMERYIERHPATSVALAFGIGLMVGAMNRARR